MRPTWLIEDGVYGDEATPLLEEIRRQGMAAGVVPHQALRKGSSPAIGGHPVAPDACVLGYGTFPFARQIQLHHRNWVPGAWCSADNLDCRVYYAYFGRYLLNEHYAMLPGVEAIRQRDWLLSVFGRDERVFVRPSGCHKLFVGRCIDGEDFTAGLAPARYDPETLVVIAAPQPIEREWRLVVIGDRVLAGCQYALSGERAVAPECPREIVEFAESMLTEVRWRPDPAFMMDVCESGERLRLVELNGFSSSWLYRCDLSAVVASASELASQMWEAEQRRTNRSA